VTIARAPPAGQPPLYQAAPGFDLTAGKNRANNRAARNSAAPCWRERHHLMSDTVRLSFSLLRAEFQLRR
jgi:hypothetical protein